MRHTPRCTVPLLLVVQIVGNVAEEAYWGFVYEGAPLTSRTTKRHPMAALHNPRSSPERVSTTSFPTYPGGFVNPGVLEQSFYEYNVVLLCSTSSYHICRPDDVPTVLRHYPCEPSADGSTDCLPVFRRLIHDAYGGCKASLYSRQVCCCCCWLP